MKKIFLILLFLTPILVGFSFRGHRWITNQAFIELPAMMDAFKNHFQTPVLESVPPAYMLPDLYESGHANEKLARNMEKHFNALVTALTAEDWSAAESEIGYVAHYCGDAASPTQNSPATWGEIDDAYDYAVDRYLETIVVDKIETEPVLITDIYQFTLDRCQESAILTDSLILFYQKSPRPEDFWKYSQHIFQKQLNLALVDCRNALYTAWDQAGHPANFPDGGGGCSNWPLVYGEDSEQNYFRQNN
jgi:hypothetical protein